jgi:hypothetical protein
MCGAIWFLISCLYRSPVLGVTLPATYSSCQRTRKSLTVIFEGSMLAPVVCSVMRRANSVSAPRLLPLKVA